MATRSVEMARAKESDFDAMWELRDIIQSLTDFREMPGKDYLTEDIEPLSDEEVAQKLSELVTEWWEKHEAAWNRVVWGAKTVIENACDLTSDVLEWRKDIASVIGSDDEQPVNITETDYCPLAGV